MTSASPAWRNGRAPGGPGDFPPDVVVQVNEVDRLGKLREGFVRGGGPGLQGQQFDVGRGRAAVPALGHDLHALQLARTHHWWDQVIDGMQGLQALYDNTGRRTEWARLVQDVTGDRALRRQTDRGVGDLVV